MRDALFPLTSMIVYTNSKLPLHYAYENNRGTHFIIAKRRESGRGKGRNDDHVHPMGPVGSSRGKRHSQMVMELGYALLGWPLLRLYEDVLRLHLLQDDGYMLPRSAVLSDVAFTVRRQLLPKRPMRRRLQQRLMLRP